uniref:Uncharacterized protein n=1 Tax=Onchocerca volvulus TaxID=6282 RepID=A0A8R1XUJ4_ONCVO
MYIQKKTTYNINNVYSGYDYGMRDGVDQLIMWPHVKHFKMINLRSAISVIYRIHRKLSKTEINTLIKFQWISKRIEKYWQEMGRRGDGK